ncbi:MULTISPECIES: RNase E specificity factor CsrD [unclassified Vibrio]|uniref:RNase E specificity factor CsrD n=1 Tax=Vibrio sp. HB236076 TaxID=3232307 RepID=A0AB39HHG5_9VIBR|nr:RNase E specificity factor CsrD [Vibrio sp. HB161653]MDP5254382.1 RNase E specificity factor CsrD [Vibrio sp. HB161653]
MRFTPTLKLSQRLVAFVTVIVVSAMFILFLGGTLSFQRLGQEYMTHYLQRIVNVVDQEMQDAQDADAMKQWLPKLLQASNVVEMEISSPAAVVYQFKSTLPQYIESQRLYHHEFALPHNSNYTISLHAIPPYVGYSYSFGAMWSITFAVVLVIFCLLKGVKWLREQLLGSELLEERGRMILAGRVEENAKGDEREWPFTASDALTRLIEELQDARQERSRFDTFIRTQTFLDRLTGSANRILFDSKLESALQESNSFGSVIQVRVQEWKTVQEQHSEQEADQFLIDLGRLLSKQVQRYPEAVFSRYFTADFAIMIPHLTDKEVSAVCQQMIKKLDQVTPLDALESDNWVHIGVTHYREGERQNLIMDEVDMALKSAELQGHNGWSRYQKWAEDTPTRGSVRWRTLLDQAMQTDKIYLFKQSAYLCQSGGGRELIHQEVTCRIYDPDHGIVKASRYLTALKQIGYETVMDKAVLNQMLNLLKQDKLAEVDYSLNLHVLPFRDPAYQRWFRDLMLQVPSRLRQRLSFEFIEANFVRYLDTMRPVARLIRGLGCELLIGQAGRTIVSSHYIKELDVQFIKLHRNLVKNIDERPENQLFVRSMIGSVTNSQTQVIAVGVERRQEWQTLQELGVDGGQGRYFDQESPLWPEQLPRLTHKTSKPKTQVKLGRRNRWKKA